MGVDPSPVWVIRNQVCLSCKLRYPEAVIRVGGKQFQECRCGISGVAHRDMEFVCGDDAKLVIPRTKWDRWRIESAGVECESKMLGTELSCGAAVHNPAARSTPATRIATPTTRLMIAGQSAFCIVSTILIKHPR